MGSPPLLHIYRTMNLKNKKAEILTAYNTTQTQLKTAKEQNQSLLIVCAVLTVFLFI